MVLEGIVHIDLTEPRDSLMQLTSGEEPEEMIVFNLPFEGEFGAWKNANRDIWLSNFRKTARDRMFELGRHQSITHLRCSRGHAFEAVITH
jgi:hypothetical protein